MSFGGKARAVKRAHFCYMTYLTIHMTMYLTFLTKVNIDEYPILLLVKHASQITR
jgi:hypothetical protein